MKTCTKCGITRPHNQFHKDSTASDGCYQHSKGCKNAAQRVNDPAFLQRLARAYQILLDAAREAEGECELEHAAEGPSTVPTEEQWLS